MKDYICNIDEGFKISVCNIDEGFKISGCRNTVAIWLKRGVADSFSIGKKDTSKQKY